MIIRINYGTGVATLPTSALDSLDRATKVDVKVLFLLCSEPNLLVAENRETSLDRISRRSGYPIGQIEASLAFWRGAGVLNSDDEEALQVPATPAPPITAGPTVESIPTATAPAEAPSNVTVSRAKTRRLDEIPNYSSDELEAFFQEHEETENYLQECQKIWGSMFSPRECSLIIALIREWGLSWDYVTSLLASVVKYFAARENQGKSLHYVYRTASNYHKEGITTLEELQQKLVEQEKLAGFEQRIRVMFGMGGRNLTPKEKKYFSTWLYEYHYDIEIVELAYNITVDAKGSPNIGYINGILKNWYEDGLTTLEAIVAKREQENSVVKSIKEWKLTPDNALSHVESILAGESQQNGIPQPANISQDINIIRRFLSLGNRMLTEGEIDAMTKWRAEYRFRYEIIHYAYQITLENRGEYNLPYMDAILNKWHEQKLTTLDAVKAYEKGYKEDKKRKKTPNKAQNQDGSFETEDFFAAAVKRSLGDDFDPAILNQ